MGGVKCSKWFSSLAKIDISAEIDILFMFFLFLSVLWKVFDGNIIMSPSCGEILTWDELFNDFSLIIFFNLIVGESNNSGINSFALFLSQNIIFESSLVLFK